MEGAARGFSTARIPEGTPPGAQKTGFLTKQGHFRKTWKKRYFVLEWPILRYYKNVGDTEPAGEINCEGVTLSDSHTMAKTDKKHCFGVFHRDREPYFLSAESAADMMEWVQAIRNTDSVGMIDFDQLKKLGEGAYGTVYLVRHRVTNQMLAMKTISKDQTRKEGAVENTKLERDILLRVRHPFVVQMQYAFATSEKLFMVMDYVNAGDLYMYICKHKRFAEPIMKMWSAEIGLAVGYLHEVGVVFRDLKPENVLLDRNGHAYLTDFGLSRTVETSGERLHTFCGTPYYLAPELITHGSTARGKGKGYTKDIDWWAVGILCYELLIGDPPFRGKSAQEVYKAIVNKPIASVEASLRRFSPEARSLIVGLLERKVDCRIGYGEADVLTFKQHPFFADIDWEKLLRKELPTGFTPEKPRAGHEDEALVDHYSRKNHEVTEVTEKPVGLVERVRRRSVEMVLGVDAAPDAASLAAMLGDQADQEEDDFQGFGFSGKDGTAVPAGQEQGRALALSLFQQYDADGNGSLDSTEIQQFAAKIGLKLTMAEAEEAVAQMELTEKKDGVVEFDEFWHWFMRKRVGVAPGTVAYRLIEARERAFQKELGAQSPMGRMLASKQRSADVAASAVSSDV